MVQIQLGKELRVAIPVKNIGTLRGNFALTCRIVNKNGVTVGNLNSVGTSTLNPSLPIDPLGIGNFTMQKVNWANGLPGQFYHLEMFDVIITVTVAETQEVVTVTDIDAVQHFEGVPIAQILTRTYTVV